MKSSKQARREAKELFRACLVDGVLDERRVQQTVQQVLAAKPRGYLGILFHFQRLVKLDLDRRAARIESAVPLPATAQASLQQSLTRLHGPGLSFTFTHNPDLIGGLRIQVGSDVYDGSIRGRLDDLQETF